MLRVSLKELYYVLDVCPKDEPENTFDVARYVLSKCLVRSYGP